MKLLQRSPNAHFSYVLGHNHLLKSKTGLFLSITAIRNLDRNFDFKVVAQGLQKTNMQAIQRLLFSSMLALSVLFFFINERRLDYQPLREIGGNRA